MDKQLGGLKDGAKGLFLFVEREIGYEAALF